MKSIKERAKTIPLETRLMVHFEMLWLSDNINPDRQTTDEEDEKAVEWAKKMTGMVIKEIKKWERDGRP